MALCSRDPVRENESRISALMQIMNSRYGDVAPVTHENAIVNFEALKSQASAYERDSEDYERCQILASKLGELREKISAQKSSLSKSYSEARLDLRKLFQECSELKTGLVDKVGQLPVECQGQVLIDDYIGAAGWILRGQDPCGGYSSPTAFLNALNLIWTERRGDLGITEKEFGELRKQAETLRWRRDVLETQIRNLRSETGALRNQIKTMRKNKETAIKAVKMAEIELEKLKSDSSSILFDDGLLTALQALPAQCAEAAEAIEALVGIAKNKVALAETLALAETMCGRKVNIEEATKIFVEADNVRLLHAYRTAEKLAAMEPRQSDPLASLTYMRSTTEAIGEFRYYSEECPIHEPFIRTSITLPLTDVPYHLFHKTPMTKSKGDDVADYALHKEGGEVVCILAHAITGYRCYVPLRFGPGRVKALRVLITKPKQSALVKAFKATTATTVTSIVTGRPLTNDTSTTLRMSKASAAEEKYLCGGTLVTAALYARLEEGLVAPLTLDDNDAIKRVKSREFASSYEAAVAARLDEQNLVYMPQYAIGGRRYDFYLPSLRLILEVDGEGHFSDIFDTVENTVRNDTEKAKIAISKDLKILRIHHQNVGGDWLDIDWLTQLEKGTYNVNDCPPGVWDRHKAEAKHLKLKLASWEA
jgi:very-short-patch-repair endonuclease/predicted  nucleic acid-binding Zn-ribbon protein